MDGKLECKVGKRYLESFLAGSLGEEEEKIFRDHYSGCDACLREIVAKDPSAIFSRLHSVSLAEDASLGGIWPAVHKEIGQRRFWARFERIPKFAATAAILLIAFGVGLLFRSPEVPPGPKEIAENMELDLTPIWEGDYPQYPEKVNTIDFNYYDEKANIVRCTIFIDKEIEESF